jgi:hypothetical protein
VEQNGLLRGETLLLTPASLTPASFRWKTGLTTAVDRLNYFYYGEAFIQTQFGVNVNLAQSIVMNFGPSLLFLGLIPGVFTRFLDRWLYQVNMIGVFSVFAAAAVFSSGGFTGDLGMVLSYALFYLLVGKILAWISEPRGRPACRAYPLSRTAQYRFVPATVASGSAKDVSSV